MSSRCTRKILGHTKGRLLWLVTFGMTIWTMWKNRGRPESVEKRVTTYVREPSPEQEQGVMALPPVYLEKVGEEAV